MSNISNAKTALNYYIQKAWEAAGLSWDSDNEAEVNAIVDGMVTGIKEELLRESGTEERIVSDLGAAAHKTLLLIANNSKSAEEVYFKYGILVRELVDYLEETVRRVAEIGGAE